MAWNIHRVGLALDLTAKWLSAPAISANTRLRQLHMVQKARKQVNTARNVSALLVRSLPGDGSTLEVAGEQVTKRNANKRR